MMPFSSMVSHPKLSAILGNDKKVYRLFDIALPQSVEYVLQMTYLDPYSHTIYKLGIIIAMYGLDLRDQDLIPFIMHIPHPQNFNLHSSQSKPEESIVLKLLQMSCGCMDLDMTSGRHTLISHPWAKVMIKVGKNNKSYTLKTKLCIPTQFFNEI